MKWKYKIVAVEGLAEAAETLTDEGLEGWEVAWFSAQYRAALLKKPMPEPQPQKEVTKPMSLTGYRTIIALSLYGLFSLASLMGFTPDSITPEKKSLIDQILLSVTGIYAALKGNSLLAAVRGKA